jgi:nitrogenase molybdenum-iron protein alpha/beta subunit
VKINVRIAALAAALSLYGAASAGAQQADTNKPGGLNKVAHDVSNTAKKAGRDTKAEAKRAGSKTHNALTDAGNETKTVLKKTTGIKGSQSHQPGGLNKVARDISKTSKKAGSDTKAEVKRVKGDVQGARSEAGKSVKDRVLKS